MGSSSKQLSVTLVLLQTVAASLESAAQETLETAGVLIAQPIFCGGRIIKLLGTQIHWVPEASYKRREEYGLSISSDGYVPALRLAEEGKAIAIWFHTHPGIEAHPLPSIHDQVVDRDLGSLFRIRTEMPYYGALIVSPRVNGFIFSGHIEDEDRSVMKIDRILVV